MPPETLREEGLPEKLRAFLAGRRVAVLGVGNALRGDDGFGPAVVERLVASCQLPVASSQAPDPSSEPRAPRPQPPPSPVVLDAGSAPENFAGRLRRERPEALLVLDAADFGWAPGELRLLSPGELAGGGLSTHAGSLAMLFDYLRAECGTDSAVLAAQAGSLKLGQGLSAPVEAAVGRAAALLREQFPAPAEGSRGA